MSGVGLFFILLIIVIIIIILVIWFIRTDDKKSKDSWVRTYDGRGNNLHNYKLGSVGGLLVRKSDKHNGETLNPRVISNSLCATERIEKDPKLSNMFWIWGQFVDHEITLLGEGSEEDPMMTPDDDQYPGRVIPFKRSAFKKVGGQRQYPNLLSCYIDGANVYGFDKSRAKALRAYDGSGKLKFSEYDGEILPPLNVDDLPNANPHKVPADTLFLAGDVRANENPMLMGLHTVFLREHKQTL